ncbi:hypothetical protein Salat_1737000 [Sesamum alatum]|uniref:Uncharacterized protein n=1 Tax=Sesamum alatum TaxID=300844 RepID=A0AAE1Y8C4_9LAMI|nr:hypothetical protein Salat_1737000 [Sesamum alatum]
MFFSKRRQIKALKKGINGVELMPLVESESTEKPVRRILRCLSKEKEPAEDSRQVNDPGETSGQQRFSGDNSGQQKEALSGNNNKVGPLKESLPRFGPLYGIDKEAVQATKKKAWEHVLKNSSEDDDPSVIMEIYSTAIRKVEKEARVTYADRIPGTGSDFRWMMIKDGCFFLQLALFILGCSEQLKYPSNDPIFGRKRNKKDIKKWLEAMFFVGNQIPLVVLKQLMNQKFFQDAIARAKWEIPPSDLCKKALYELLILPAVKRNLPLKWGSNLADQQPSDMLHGLQHLLIGLGPSGNLSCEYEADDDIDLEANEEDIEDYERIFTRAIADDGNETSPSNNFDGVRMFLNAIGFRSAIDDRKRIFPCATELKRAGVHIKKLKNGGVRSICFKSYYVWAYLYLPVFPVDDHTELIFRNLKTYEISHQQSGKHRREVSSYLRVMSDIIQTTKDAKLLEKRGIIQGNSDDVEKLPGILYRLSCEDIRLTHEFHTLRSQIRGYSSPWIHYKGVVNLVVFLTLLQTFLALLSYFRPPKP